MNASSVFFPHEADVIENITESPTIFTLRLRLADHALHRRFRFNPGQFNMLYLLGVGEVAISIVSDPKEEEMLDHTIRIVGRVTKGLARLKSGDKVGIRGPFGRGWDMAYAKNKDVIVITGGIGCAPSVSVINYILRRRNEYKSLKILQGVKHTDDFFYRDKFDAWRAAPNTEVLLAANAIGDSEQAWHRGFVIELLDEISIQSCSTVVKMCGPEIMMLRAIEKLKALGLDEKNIFLTMERNMHCAVGHCGHCQFGGKFICKDGPVFNYPEVKTLLGQKGF